MFTIPQVRSDIEPDHRPSTMLVRRIDVAQHASFIERHSAIFRQLPDWAATKPGHRAESLGWFDGDQLVGTALVLYRRVPGSRRSLAHVPDGPNLPWSEVGMNPARWLDPFVAHLRAEQAFAIRIGPTAVVRLWQAPTAQRGLAEPQRHRFADLIPDELWADGGALLQQLPALGWQPTRTRFGVRLGLDRSVPQLLGATTQEWRRDVARSVQAGVVVREGSSDDLAVFHRLHVETARREGFTPRPAEHFERLWRALTGGPVSRIRLYLAELGPDGSGEAPPVLAGAIVLQAGPICWSGYTASADRHREAEATTAVQWQAILDAKQRGCHTYDLNEVPDSLDPEAGPLGFRLSTGGYCVETVGEWELPLAPAWHTAFRVAQLLRPPGGRRATSPR
jgi:lipid II:glycine glycyltransferase (peptidoglycan interpeptide bridge formation enzyme)